MKSFSNMSIIFEVNLKFAQEDLQRPFGKKILTVWRTTIFREPKKLTDTVVINASMIKELYDNLDHCLTLKLRELASL